MESNNRVNSKSPVTQAFVIDKNMPQNNLKQAFGIAKEDGYQLGFHRFAGLYWWDDGCFQ